MQKTIKRIALLLALTLAVTCAALFTVACGNTETGYSVQVVCDDNDVDFTKLTVQWCKANSAGESSGSCFGRPSQLNADGKATPQDARGELDLTTVDAPYGFHIQLNNLEKIGYTYVQGQSLHVTEKGEFKIKIVKA